MDVTMSNDANTTALAMCGVFCTWCDTRVIIYSEGPVTDPPKGWYIAGGDEWICPDHDVASFDPDLQPSEAEYFAVVEVSE